MEEKWKMIVFLIGIAIALRVLFCTKEQNEGWVPAIAFCSSLGAMFILIAINKLMIYINKE